MQSPAHAPIASDLELQRFSSSLGDLVASAVEAATGARSQGHASNVPRETGVSHVEAKSPEVSPSSPQYTGERTSQASGTQQGYKWAASPILSETQVEHLSDAELRALFKTGSAEIPGFDHKNEYQFCKGHTLANPWNSNEGGECPQENP